jgi:excisionase family DNA binding protein
MLDADPIPGMLSLAEVERILSMSRSQIYRLRRAGQLEFIKIGRGTRVTKYSLRRYINSATPKAAKNSPMQVRDEAGRFRRIDP